MKINAIDTTLSAANLTAIKSKIEETKSMMPFLLALSAQERRARFKMSSKRFEFVSKVIAACKAQPVIIPAWIELDELERDYELSNQLFGVENMLESLLIQVKDTRMQLGSEALKSAADVYSLTQKSKDRLPGIKAIYETLRASYPGRGKNKDKNL